jgi:hypothetical protein
MEIKKNLEFRCPLKISRNPPPHNKDKYCDFHEAASHHIEGYIALLLLIEKFITNGKLVRFLGEHRNQLGKDRPQNQHRDHHPQNYQAREYPSRDRAPGLHLARTSSA